MLGLQHISGCVEVSHARRQLLLGSFSSVDIDFYSITFADVYDFIGSLQKDIAL